MNGFFAFLKKEFFELSRSGKLIIIGFIFVLFGIMNPAVAKLTPWILEQSADSFDHTGKKSDGLHDINSFIWNSIRYGCTIMPKGRL